MVHLVTWLLMKAGDEDRFTENVAVHGVDHSRASVGGLLRCALRDFELRVQGEQLERVVMIRPRWGAGTHVRVSP